MSHTVNSWALWVYLEMSNQIIESIILFRNEFRTIKWHSFWVLHQRFFLVAELEGNLNSYFWNEFIFLIHYVETMLTPREDPKGIIRPGVGPKPPKKNTLSNRVCYQNHVLPIWWAVIFFSTDLTRTSENTLNHE